MTGKVATFRTGSDRIDTLPMQHHGDPFPVLEEKSNEENGVDPDAKGEKGIIGKAVETIQNFWNPKKAGKGDEKMEMDDDMSQDIEFPEDGNGGMDVQGQINGKVTNLQNEALFNDFLESSLNAEVLQQQQQQNLGSPGISHRSNVKVSRNSYRPPLAGTNDPVTRNQSKQFNSIYRSVAPKFSQNGKVNFAGGAYHTVYSRSGVAGNPRLPSWSRGPEHTQTQLRNIHRQF
jgi:hypothetical protein